jgi:putative DNA primase/helicase
VIVFADNDENFAGQAAAHRLAHRLSVKNRIVRVEVPSVSGWDWNDVLWQEWAAKRDLKAVTAD